jgi:hypothetical protein
VLMSVAVMHVFSVFVLLESSRQGNVRNTCCGLREKKRSVGTQGAEKNRGDTTTACTT